MSYPGPNRNGVYLREQCEVIELPAGDAAEGKRRRLVTPSAEIMLVQAGRRRWLASAGYSLHSGDMRSHGSLPHDETEQEFPDRESALTSMLEYLLEQMNRVFLDRERGERRQKAAVKAGRYDPGCTVAQSEVREAERVARWAAAQLNIEAPEQLLLWAAA